MRTLVTGGAGYVGNQIVEFLLDRGHEVRVLDSFLFGDDALDPLREGDRLEVREVAGWMVEGDIADRFRSSEYPYM